VDVGRVHVDVETYKMAANSAKWSLPNFLRLLSNNSLLFEAND